MFNISTIFNITFDFFICFIENYLIISLLNLFFVQKKEQTFIYASLLTVLSSLVMAYIYPPIYASFALLFFLYIYTYFNLQGSRQLKIVIPLLVFMNLFLVNISFSLISTLFNIPINHVLSTYSIEYFIVSSFTKCILFIEYIFTKKYIHKELYISKETWFLSVILIIVSIILPSIIITHYINGTIQSQPLVFMTLSQFIMTHFLIYRIYIHSHIDHQTILEKELLLDTYKHSETMLKIIEERVDEMNRLNHDLNNHKLVMERLYQNHQSQELQEYIDGLFDSSHYVYINNDIMNYILNQKINIAKKKDIDVKCLIQGDFEKTISIIDLNIILGNLLDNAIEAAQNAEIKYIEIHIHQDINHLYIKIKNTYYHIKKEHHSFISTKNDPHHHGYGIPHIQMICQKYHGENIITFDQNYFIHSCLFFFES